MTQDTATIARELRKVKKQLGRKEMLGWVLGRLNEQMMVATAEVIESFLDEQVDELLARGRWEPVRMGDMQSAGEVVCRRCGARARGQFWRNGHFKRVLVTDRGQIQVRVPMLRCRRCKASGKWDKWLWGRFERLVGDWDEQLMEWIEHGSVRAFARHMARRAGLRIAPSTLGKRLKEAEERYRKWCEEPLVDVARVLVVDGLWFPVGKGPGRKGRKASAVVAIGLWPEQGRCEIVDFEIGAKEDEEVCRRLFERLLRRGWERPELVVSDDNAAYRAAAQWVWPQVRWQLCITHKLRAARRKAPRGKKRKFTAQAREIFEAGGKAEAEARAREFAKKWYPQAPEAVRSLMRNLEMALTFYEYPASWRKAIRTNNAAESAMRRLRDGLRRAGGSPGSKTGAIAIFLASALSFNSQNP